MQSKIYHSHIAESSCSHEVFKISSVFGFCVSLKYLGPNLLLDLRKMVWFFFPPRNNIPGRDGLFSTCSVPPWVCWFWSGCSADLPEPSLCCSQLSAPVTRIYLVPSSPVFPKPGSCLNTTEQMPSFLSHILVMLKHILSVHWFAIFAWVLCILKRTSFK